MMDNLILDINIRCSDDIFESGLVAEWRLGPLRGAIYREGKNNLTIIESAKDIADECIKMYFEYPEKSIFSIFSKIDQDYIGRIDTLGEVQITSFYGERCIRAFVGKEDYNIYFCPDDIALARRIRLQCASFLAAGHTPRVLKSIWFPSERGKPKIITRIENRPFAGLSQFINTMEQL